MTQQEKFDRFNLILGILGKLELRVDELWIYTRALNNIQAAQEEGVDPIKYADELVMAIADDPHGAVDDAELVLQAVIDIIQVRGMLV